MLRWLSWAARAMQRRCPRFPPGWVRVVRQQAAQTRYGRTAFAGAATPAILWGLGQANVAILFLVLTALVFIKHRANIARLFAGTEPRIGKPAVNS